MPNGVSALDLIQIGIEQGAHGASTDVVTAIWRGEGTKKDTTVVTRSKEKLGRLGGTTRTYVPKTGTEITLTSEATFEQLGYIFQTGIYHTTPTTDASSAQIWAWSVQSASSDPIASTDIDTLVIEDGDNAATEIQRFCFVTDWTLEGKWGEAVMVTGVFQGRQASTATGFTTGTTDTTVETILTSLGSLYIDNTTDAAGTTTISNTLLDFSLKHNTGWKAIEAKDNRKDFSDIKRVGDEMTLDVTFEHNATAETEKAAWRAETERVIRLTFLGSALTTTDAGATYDTKALVVDLYGKWDTFGAAGLEDQDGDNVYKGTFRVGYSTTAAAKANITLVNELAALA